MCGISGLVLTEGQAAPLVYNSMIALQHRGQDAAGIAASSDMLREHKASGLVRDVFLTEDMKRLTGRMAIGHVRYPTQGSATDLNPVTCNSPFGLALVHNGNIINSKELQIELQSKYYRLMMTTSDSEVLVNLFSVLLEQRIKDASIAFESGKLPPSLIFQAVSDLMKLVKGSYSIVMIIHGIGMVTFRDPRGIRPLIMGSKTYANSTKKDYIFTSESAGLSCLEFEVERDVDAGEAILVFEDGSIHTQQCSQEAKLQPCIFEWVYLSRPDSIIDGSPVYEARRKMGELLAKNIQRSNFMDNDIDVVVPIPECSVTAAASLAATLNVDYQEGLVKNRYIGRTFIMPDQSKRANSVRQKLNTIESVFKGKSVLLVDDSIVRGTTSKHIIDMVRKCGARRVGIASAAPMIRHPNIFGLDTPSHQELIAKDGDLNYVREVIQADDLIFQDLDDLIRSVREVAGPNGPESYEISMFDGLYGYEGIGADAIDKMSQRRTKDRT